jgi:hypothetical protein
VLPAAIAMGKNHIGTMAGKLNGEMIPTGPIGCRMEWTSALVEAFSVIPPFSRWGIPQANSTTSWPRDTSPAGPAWLMPKLVVTRQWGRVSGSGELVPAEAAKQFPQSAVGALGRRQQGGRDSLCFGYEALPEQAGRPRLLPCRVPDGAVVQKNRFWMSAIEHRSILLLQRLCKHEAPACSGNVQVKSRCS